MSAAGSARRTTFLRNLPCTSERFGSMARMNAGTPIVMQFTRPSCAGLSGYGRVKIRLMIAIAIENMFFTK